jgi:hypothetical protein
MAQKHSYVSIESLWIFNGAIIPLFGAGSTNPLVSPTELCSLIARRPPRMRADEGRGSGGGMMVYAYWCMFSSAVVRVCLLNVAKISQQQPHNDRSPIPR